MGSRVHGLFCGLTYIFHLWEGAVFVTTGEDERTNLWLWQSD